MKTFNYGMGTLLLVLAAAGVFGEFHLVGAILIVPPAFLWGYYFIYKALGPVDLNVLFDGLLEDR